MEMSLISATVKFTFFFFSPGRCLYHLSTWNLKTQKYQGLVRHLEMWVSTPYPNLVTEHSHN